MPEDSLQSSLHPTRTSHNLNDFDCFQNVASPPIALPAPTSTQGLKSHQRARTAVDLPPLFPRTASTSPTRSPNFLPFLRPNSLRSVSPERVSAKDAAEFEVDLTPPEEAPPPVRAGNKVDRLANWFNGSSDPINISLVPSPSRERPNAVTDPFEMERIFSGSLDSVDSLTQRPQKRPSIYTNSTQSSSRFSFFRKTSQAQLQSELTPVDDLAQLDVATALFPAGPIDEFSPAAFKNLQMNAEGTIRRLQEAYRQHVQALKSTTSQNNIQADELEAATTRNEHLKLQLTEMAERAAEQDRKIMALQEELAQNSEFATALPPRQSIRMVSQDSSKVSNTSKRAQCRRSRVSEASTLNESETESDISSAISIFSEAQSICDSPGTSIAASPVYKHILMSKMPRLQPSLLHDNAPPIQVLDCQKCHGFGHSEAWDVISIMKEEKTALKNRIEELEGAQDDALDFLSGLKLSTR